MNGNENPFVFTWFDDSNYDQADPTQVPVYSVGSGCSTFYNTVASDDGVAEGPSTHFQRDYDGGSFTVVALRDIAPGDELTHAYKGKEW